MDPQAILSRDVGVWRADVTVHMGPNAPSTSTGSMTGRLVAGGRWLVLDYLNPESGFGGHGVYGWDAAADCFVGTWVDNMTGTLRVMRGTWDEATGAVTYEGEIVGPPTFKNRQVTTAPTGGVRHFSSDILLPDGQWAQVMSAVYTRQAG